MAVAKAVPDKITSKDMVRLLKNHYLPENVPPGGILATEIGSPDGKRFADALWQSMTRSGGMKLVGHEIKVSRADVMVELKDIAKAEPWMQYCDQWWLTVSDPAIVEGLDIPSSWGIMSPPSGRKRRSMTIIQDAPMLKPISKDAGLLRLLTWQSMQTAKTVQEATMQKETAERKAGYLQDQLDSSLPQVHPSAVQRIVQEVVEKLEKRLEANPLNKYGFGSSFLVPQQDVDAIVDAIYDYKIVVSTSGALANDTRNIANALENLDRYFMRDAREKIAALNEHLIKKQEDDGSF